MEERGRDLVRGKLLSQHLYGRTKRNLWKALVMKMMSAPRLHRGTSSMRGRKEILGHEPTCSVFTYLPEHSIHYKFNEINYSLTTPLNHPPLTGVSTFFRTINSICVTLVTMRLAIVC